MLIRGMPHVVNFMLFDLDEVDLVLGMGWLTSIGGM